MSGAGECQTWYLLPTYKSYTENTVPTYTSTYEYEYYILPTSYFIPLVPGGYELY